MTQAISIIRQEHRSLAAVLHALRFLADEWRAGRGKPDFPLVDAILDYIDVFPERMHHPKENDFLFVAIMRRSNEAAEHIETLKIEHESGGRMIRDLRYELLRFRDGAADGAKRFADLVDEYCEFNWRHMRLEEEVILPLAERVVTAEDWAKIDAAFLANDDPMFGVEPRKHFEQLLSRIAQSAPPPIGIGPARAA